MSSSYTVRLSGGAGRSRFVFSGRIMSKATVSKILSQYGVKVVQNCKDCDFLVVPDLVSEASNSAKKATHHQATTIKITKFIKLLVAQRHGSTKKPKSTHSSVKHAKPHHTYRTRNTTKRAYISNA